MVMRLLLVLAQQDGQVLDKRRITHGSQDLAVLRPYIIITLECKVNRVILHSLLHIVKRWVAGRRYTRRASAVHGRLQ